MRYVGLDFILLFAAIALSGAGLFFALARIGFTRAWGEFRALRQERLARATGLLSPALESARLDPFRHLSEELVPQGLRFSPLGAPARRAIEGPTPVSHGADPLLQVIQAWEDHHHAVSQNFLEALGHVAHHRLVPHSDIHEKIEPIGDAILRLVEECLEPSLQKELRMAYSGLKTGAEQNLEYVSRRLHETARETHSAFHEALGNAHSELSRVREEMIRSICLEADEEIEKFMESHSGIRLNPLAWGRQTAYYREFEQLRNELGGARRAGNLSQVALIVVMIVEDENRFVAHLHAAARSHDELHERLTHELRKSADQLRSEAHTLTGWASQENQRLQSTVSHQLIQHLERWKGSSAPSSRSEVCQRRLSAWIDELTKLRDRDPELAAAA